MTEPTHSPHKTAGHRRIMRAMRNDWNGIVHAARHDPALREVSIAVFALTITSAFLPVPVIERLLLAFATLLVLLMEVVNSAIEATVDRISLEHHPLAGHAKDLAGMAVGIAALMASLCWIVIAGPLVWRWLA